MQDRFIFTKYRTNCYHCGKDAEQMIKAVPYQAQVQCGNCGATRIFIPRNEDVSKPGSFTSGCYDLWSLYPMRNAGTAMSPDPMTWRSGAVTSRCGAETAGSPISTSSTWNTSPSARSRIRREQSRPRHLYFSSSVLAGYAWFLRNPRATA